MTFPVMPLKFYDEEGNEVPYHEIHTNSPEIHTVPTREQHELMTRLYESLDKEIEAMKKRGFVAFS